MRIPFNVEIIKTDFRDREVVVFFDVKEMKKVKEIKPNMAAINTRIILITTEFEGVLKFLSRSNSEFFGNISERLKKWSPFDNSFVKLYCTTVSKLW